LTVVKIAGVARFTVAGGQMVMVTGVSFPPRARVCADSIQGILLSQKIAAPPRKGHRSELAGEVPWRRIRAYEARRLRSSI
jgi:hypothetical protein